MSIKERLEKIRRHETAPAWIDDLLDIVGELAAPPDKQPALKAKTRGEEVAEGIIQGSGSNLVVVESDRITAGYCPDSVIRPSLHHAIAAAIDAEIKREREECASLADSYTTYPGVPHDIARWIRARGE